MSIQSVNPSFGSSYKVDMSQRFDTREKCLKRDFVVGYWAGYSINSDEVMAAMKKNPDATVTLRLPEKYDADFEKTLRVVGQKFDKAA
ncbi:MAG: hypothetical protein LBK53_09870 [Heliobacteriaceae bacterium]|jgi:hypothetical protein|nr:hypothetical protein [Heliobacteriaceae bacterium]